MNIFVEKREGEGFTMITTQARESSSEDMGYSSNPRVVYAFTDMSNVVNTAGWSHNRVPERAKIQVQGATCNPNNREPFVKQLSGAEVLPFLVLDFIEATKWLLPPPNY
ncbi:hypothetical protein Gohar_005392 [Gossypium harknessii]|uniref:Uncharacterized protein n=1 Tax=Gossypium harknessii TaxID=34285 RepID=A0A7J9HAG2_9ROSI|nr:hypothetical protein [Gossypium harknessii]